MTEVDLNETPLKESDTKKQPQQGEMSGLDKMLAPLVQLTRYSGLLYDWCTPVEYSNQGWKWFVATSQTLVVFASLFILICAIAFQFIRLVVVYNSLGDKAGSQEFLVAATMFSILPAVFLTQIIFLLRRSELLAFFADWRQQLAEIDDWKSSTGLKKKIIIIYCIYFVYIFLSFGALGFIVIYRPDQLRIDDWATVISYGPYTRFVGFILLVSALLINIFCLLIDIVPSFVYYQAGVAVQVLVDRWESILLQKDPGKIQRIISLYNSIESIVTRADYLFGPVVVVNHGTIFFFICMLTSSVLKPSLWKEYKSDDAQNFLINNLIFFFARLVWPMVFKSKLYRSSERLKTAVLSSYSESPSITDENQKSSTVNSNTKSVKKFAFLLANKSVVACPCGLYNITPSIFLAMFSLLVTYTIIILQSQC